MQLSTRQRQILVLLSEGRSNKEIARELGTSPRTVDSHLQRLYARNGVNSRVALVVKWLKAEPAAGED